MFCVVSKQLTDSRHSKISQMTWIPVNILGKEDWNSQESDCVVMSSDITVNTETSMAAPGLSGQAAATGGADESSSQERRNKDTTINNQHSTGQDENAGNNNCSTSRVQGSGNPVANNPWQLGKSSHEPASNEFFPMEEPQPQIQHLSHLVEQDVRGQDLGSDSSLEQDSDCELSGEQVDSLSGLSENVHQSQGPAIRPSLLTQNSCYDQPVDSAEFEDEEGKLSLVSFQGHPTRKNWEKAYNAVFWFLISFHGF